MELKAMTFQDIVDFTNWRLLQQQKLTLLRLADADETSPEDQEHINGVISFLECIQDYVVDGDYVIEEEAFDR